MQQLTLTLPAATLTLTLTPYRCTMGFVSHRCVPLDSDGATYHKARPLP